MRDDMFRQFLTGQHQTKSGGRLLRGPIDNAVSRCRRIEKRCGSLDDAYVRDRMAALTAQFRYSTEENAKGQHPRHGIRIKGNPLTGTASLRDALSLYTKFCRAHPPSQVASARPPDKAPTAARSGSAHSHVRAPRRKHPAPQGADAGVVLRTYALSSAAEHAEYPSVMQLAQRLHAVLNEPLTLQAITAANMPGKPSHDIQQAFSAAAKELGFASERKGLFETSIPGLRPDFYRAVGQSGILMEVERGKTTTNNMDLLDFWKCHISGHANYLFLLVPRELRHNAGMSPKREFESVCRRLEPFFKDANRTNVRALFAFGY